jgi:hypothetical protein
MNRREIMLAGGAAWLTGQPQSAAAMGPKGASSAGARSFDFLHGSWKVIHRKRRKRLAGDSDWFDFPGDLTVGPILAGLGNFDDNRLADPGGAYQAHSLRIFNPATGLWSIWWLDSRFPALDAPVVGRFDGAKGSFFVDDNLDGRPIRVRTTYESLGDRTAQWTQAFSPDAGASWEVNWIMDFTRA